MDEKVTTDNKQQYPIVERAGMVNQDEIEIYLDRLFGRVMFKKNHHINVRGIGEKGTPKEGRFQEDCWLQPAQHDHPEAVMLSDVTRWATNWAQYDIATYIVPCVLNQGRGLSEAVELFTHVVVDLDTGDTYGKASYLADHLGVPSMVVASGGVTEFGTPKMHVYYLLNEATTDIARIVELRHTLAVKIGGDIQFGRGTNDNPNGRAHQPIRIPGTVHAKNSQAAPVHLLRHDGDEYELDFLAESIRRMPSSPWAIGALAQSVEPVDNSINGFGGMFDPNNFAKSDISTSLLEEIHEGGEDKTRFGEFSKVVGHYIYTVRTGALTLEQAREAAHGWMLAKMVPPWPQARFDKEWKALVSRDVAARGAFPMEATAPQKPMVADESLGLKEHAVHRWTNGPAPGRNFLVDGLILAGKPHLLVAEGGAGKTFSALELCLKIACKEEGVEETWMGQTVTAETGTVVMFTTEDDRDELWRRFETFDPEGRRFKAGFRLIVVALVNAGGAYTLAEKGTHGNITMSYRWSEALRYLREIPDLRLVVIDTLNTTLHGEENSATVVNEYARMLQPVCGELNAALIVTHHVRKPSDDKPIRTPDDMLAAVRGSSALPAAFRAVIGIWHAHDWGKALQAMGKPVKPKMLWRMAVLKSNNPDMVEGVRTLYRQNDGLLGDVTSEAKSAVVNEGNEQTAWLLLAIELAAKEGCPYTNGSRNDKGGLFKRHGELPPAIRDLSWRRLDTLREKLTGAGDVVVCAGKGSTVRSLLDIPDGPFADSVKGEQVKGGSLPARDWGSYHYDMEENIVVLGAKANKPAKLRMTMAGMDHSAGKD